MLDENKIKDIHNLLLTDITVGGVYRQIEIQRTGASHIPPLPTAAFYQLKSFYKSLEDNNYNDFDIAAFTHAEFVRIHPFEDRNGRTSRIVMNYQLIKNGYLPISIKKEDRFKYYEVLDEYAVNNNLNPFIELIYD